MNVQEIRFKQKLSIKNPPHTKYHSKRKSNFHLINQRASFQYNFRLICHHIFLYFYCYLKNFKRKNVEKPKTKQAVGMERWVSRVKFGNRTFMYVKSKLRLKFWFCCTAKCVNLRKMIEKPQMRSFFADALFLPFNCAQTVETF